MRRVLVLAASIIAIHPPGAQAEWLTLRTEHHQVAGNVSSRELREIGLRLEQFREVIQTLNQLSVRAIADTPVVVLAFPDSRSYRPFTPVVNGRDVPSAGLFVSGIAGAFIVLNLGAPEEGYRPVYHEFSHFLLRGVFGAAPLWFSEGLAEYYSTFEVTSDGRRAIIGKPIPQHVELLRQRRLPLSRLLSITAASPEYTEDTPDRHLLYAQAWALIHHALHQTPQRRDAVVALASKIAAGATPEQAVLETYGMTLPELERELQAYVRREVYSATGFEFKHAVVTALRTAATAADQLDVDAWLGSIQATVGREDEAAVRLERVLKARPDHGIAHAGMATVRMRQGRNAEVQAHLQAAAKANVLPLRTNQVQITGREARQAAARVFLKTGNYQGVRDALAPIVRSGPDGHEDALILAEALLHLDDPDGARALLGPVLATAATAAQADQARALLGRAATLRATLGNPPDVPPAAPRASGTASRGTDAPGTPPRNGGVILSLRAVRQGEQRIFGTLQAIECGRDGVVIVVRAPQGITRGSAASLAAVEFVTFRSQAAGNVTCGAQTEVPALLTIRAGTPSRAVALELLPDGYTP